MVLPKYNQNTTNYKKIIRTGASGSYRLRIIIIILHLDLDTLLLLLQVAPAAQEWAVDLNEDFLGGAVLACQDVPLPNAVRLGELLPAVQEVHVSFVVEQHLRMPVPIAAICLMQIN